MTHPAAVTACNLDLENLITDSNRSIATLAITTLLKTGSESSVDRLMKQIATFVNEISDEFKVNFVKFWDFFYCQNEKIFGQKVPLHTELFTTQCYIKSQKISKTAISFNPEPR